MGETRNAYSILVGKPEGMRPLGRLWRRWEDIIRMDLRDIGWESVDLNKIYILSKGKRNAEVFPCITKYHAMKMYPLHN
jgi:hypothetical protein